jgi:hypothetical protein
VNPIIDNLADHSRSGQQHTYGEGYRQIWPSNSRRRLLMGYRFRESLPPSGRQGHVGVRLGRGPERIRCGLSRSESQAETGQVQIAPQEDATFGTRPTPTRITNRTVFGCKFVGHLSQATA